MSLLRDHELARAFDHASRTYDILTRLNPSYRTTDPDAALETVRTVLRPDGRFAAHEYSLSGSRVHRALWTAVCHALIIPAGTFTGDRDLYRHLWHSVNAFDSAPAFAVRLTRAGLTSVRVAPVAGWQKGIVHTFLARKSGSSTARKNEQ